MNLRKTKKNKSNRKKTLKMKGGDKFEGLRYISMGAQGATYLTPDNRVLKVIKAGTGVEEEVYIQGKLNELDLPYFPRLIASGEATSQRNFKLIGQNEWRELSSFFNNNNTPRRGPHRGTYVVMEYVGGGKIFPKYFSDKIRSIVPGLDRPLTEEEVSMLTNEFLDIFSKLSFALYVADKVFNYRHKDFHENNCLIKPNGDPVVIDFGGSRFYNNRTRNERNANSGHDLRTLLSTVSAIGNYDYDVQPYMGVVLDTEPLRQLTSLPFRSRWHHSNTTRIRLPIESIASRIELIKTGEKQPFDYTRTFSNIGIDRSMIERAAEKIENRQVIVDPEYGQAYTRAHREEGIARTMEFGVSKARAEQLYNFYQGNDNRIVAAILNPKDKALRPPPPPPPEEE